MTIDIKTFAGRACLPLISDVARLRISVFREWPYLYQGSQSYEEDYLRHFAEAADAIVVAAFDGDSVVGVATASSLAGHTEEFVPLFNAAGYDATAIFYCGESVLLPAYRGRGIGHTFFDYREQHAATLVDSGRTITHSAFCAVIRDPNDPRTPAHYRPLDSFWMKRGYEPIPGLIGNYAWQEIGDDHERDHSMQFWVKGFADQPPTTP